MNILYIIIIATLIIILLYLSIIIKAITTPHEKSTLFLIQTQKFVTKLFKNPYFDIKEINFLRNTIKETNDKLEMALKAGALIPMEWDIINDIFTISIPKIKKEYSQLNQDVPGISSKELLNNVHIDDQATVLQSMNDLKTGVRHAIAITIRYDVTKKFDHYFELHFITATDSNGNISKIIGYMQDVTERHLVAIEKEDNEKFLDSILGGIPFPVHVIDVEDDFRYIYWNKESTKIFGNGLNKTVKEIVAPELFDTIIAATNEVYTTGKSTFYQEHVKISSGQEYETLVAKSIIYRHQKPLILVVRWDITNLLELQRNEKLLSSSINYFNGFTWKLDVETGIFNNGKGLQIQDNEENTIFTITQLIDRIHPDDKEKFLNIFDKYSKNEKNEFSISYRASITNSDKFTWWECRGILDSTKINNHAHIYMYGINISIQKHKEAEEKLSNALIKAEESDRLKLAFLANMSHEIRTPLNAIIGFANLICLTDDNKEKEEYSNIIALNNELLLRLIDDILELSKIESRTLEFSYEELDMAIYFDELVTTMQYRMTNPNVKLISINPYKSCLIYVDKVRMAEVLTNYMTNAIKYTPRGYIKIGYEYVNGGLKIFVTDTGIGIPDSKKSRVFQRFEKLDSFAQGSGLGLSICKALTEINNGKVGFESTENVGSTFWAWRPLVAKIIPKGDDSQEFQTIQPTIPAKIRLKDNDNDTNSTRILIAEDNDSNFLLIKAILKNYGVISRATDGIVAVNMAKNEEFDLILMDIKMPNMDGLQATKEIRNFNCNIPIIALTANAFESDKTNAFQAGCNDFITKPVKSAELKDIINKYRNLK
ncbi:MAG: response regulator [Muribaculaceae bacterium]